MENTENCMISEEQFQEWYQRKAEAMKEAQDQNEKLQILFENQMEIAQVIMAFMDGITKGLTAFIRQ